ncbi:phosphocholine cytidylyltransferase family protein [Helicobacter aurati]|uniref:Phosphocholine cytidylyltransferase family protein n=1 Tax=Helicobacter aurati TaxID=137778 RepID=A0A3D8J283_9HELI|nr:phosphocholine cytidylyltransferase family protein [Helicobacter aurati]RDU71255.1 phosphocholine cytidylyltransferase family protein [Helicobacter aurati]
MKAIILAAGFGSRLMPLTKDKPKCMVEYQGKKLIDYQIEALYQANIKDIAIVGGYKFAILQHYLQQKYDLLQTFYQNPQFDSTNMVATLFCAKQWLFECAQQQHDVIVSYSDIVYFSDTVNKLVAADKELCVVIDKDWHKLWSKRFDNPLSDAETLKLQDDKIIEIGKKPQHSTEIEGQYIGLFKISWNFLKNMVDYYENLDKQRIYDGKDYANMYMTSFLQLLIDTFHNVYGVNIYGNWCEIDSCNDLNINIKSD